VLTISDIGYSANPCITAQTIIVSCKVTETNATWQDVKSKTWNAIKTVAQTWDRVKRKYF
jgi:hypothetical protein